MEPRDQLPTPAGHWAFDFIFVPHSWMSGLTQQAIAQLIGDPRTYGLTSLSEKTRKAHHLLMSMQRQPFLLNYFKTLSRGPTRAWTLASQLESQKWWPQHYSCWSLVFLFWFYFTLSDATATGACRWWWGLMRHSTAVKKLPTTAGTTTLNAPATPLETVGGQRPRRSTKRQPDYYGFNSTAWYGFRSMKGRTVVTENRWHDRSGDVRGTCARADRRLFCRKLGT